MELCDQTAARLAALLRKGEIRSRDIVESVFRRIGEREESIHAYISTGYDAAMKQAEEADSALLKKTPASVLAGIPTAVKDNLCTRQMRTTCGSRILENYVPPYDATAVKRIMEGGAVMTGKTNMDEFGMGSSTETSFFGPTRNPWNPEFVPGGSSGGSAAAVAAGEAIVALGTDTGGSIRLPSAYCGVVGIKPTYGRVSRYGLISYASSLDQVGAIGRSVEDCAMVLSLICGHDPRDTTSAPVKMDLVLESLKKGIKGLRIGLPAEYFVEGLDPRVKDMILGAASLLERNGARVKEVSLPHAGHAISAYYLIATAEASSNLARYDGVKYGFRAEEVRDTLQMYELTRSMGFGREVKRRIMLGTYALSAGYYDAYYLKAQEARALIRRDFDKAFEQVDSLIAPVSPGLPFRLGEKMDDPLQMYLVDVYTVSVNLAGLPAMSIPCGMVDGLPAGMQIIGRPFDEETVLRVGHAYEQLNGAGSKKEES
ncbi:MAG: Asp-tRNA(Asn)/Glu-tRNA(Gln) amidotransferase GatCAB subunit A [Deltaproteobacteria bacterium HGW-Deltaproteobacteria-15]|nr:MAG: Asp-tRNA(Asn)/Glu-tRNA(Gln) amidotransferase GatCAB subunit A [Deltaproteobacteria bacterium HGW-Deltaproteobacteria-15]